jgi:hypothetical protein
MRQFPEHSRQIAKHFREILKCQTKLKDALLMERREEEAAGLLKEEGIWRAEARREGLCLSGRKKKRKFCRP